MPSCPPGYSNYSGDVQTVCYCLKILAGGAALQLQCMVTRWVRWVSCQGRTTLVLVYKKAIINIPDFSIGLDLLMNLNWYCCSVFPRSCSISCGYFLCSVLYVYIHSLPLKCSWNVWRKGALTQAECKKRFSAFPASYTCFVWK